jgi:hypothetical protein
MENDAVDKAFTNFPSNNSCPKCGWIVDYGCGCVGAIPTIPLVPYDPNHPNLKSKTPPPQPPSA